jgi:transcriptional regulator
LARANPHWHEFRSGKKVLALFLGPHAMIPSDWYSNPSEIVPTWNYVAVYAWGIPTLIEGEAETLDLLSDMMKFYQAQGSPMSLKPPTSRATELARAIVGFEIEITQLQGKWKLSQNRTPEDRLRVREALLNRRGLGDVEVSLMMTELDAGLKDGAS